jgi:hypothetical protein
MKGGRNKPASISENQQEINWQRDNVLSQRAKIADNQDIKALLSSVKTKTVIPSQKAWYCIRRLTDTFSV